MDRSRRGLVELGAERVSNISSTDFPGHHLGEDNSWNFERWRKNLHIQIMRKSNRSIEFDAVGLDASIANAFRRIMIAEVPTVCIEYVYIWDNTTVVHDEVLASRLGLVPLNVHPHTVEFRTDVNQPTDRDTIVFTVEVHCTRKPGASKTSTNPDDLYINHEFKSSHLQWEPQGSQNAQYENSLKPGPLNPNIVLDKLRPGQSVKMQLHAVKGVGKDHAKFSPVATATYRLLPQIDIKKHIPPNLAEKFQKSFSPGVINIDPQTKEVSVDPKGVRRDTVSREVLRHPEFEGYVQLSRVRDHFLFSVESESAYKPEEIFLESVQIMRTKIDILRTAALALKAGPEQNEDVAMDDS
ncbi:DNA-directed RNA polymerase [Flagelloscypha sp. PMI_526]|nr:DNA-directed RNA polymerase [Flagelloscypha sp. PMI_526]